MIGKKLLLDLRQYKKMHFKMLFAKCWPFFFRPQHVEQTCSAIPQVIFTCTYNIIHMHKHLHMLNHWGRVMHICISKLIIIGSDNVTWLVPNHYVNQCWNIVNWIPRNKLQWNLIRNSYIFIKENVFENVIWKMPAIFHGLSVLTKGQLLMSYDVMELDQQ